MDAFCRANSIPFICCEVAGAYAKTFNDFGDNFEVLDKNGEESRQVFISSIE